MDDEPLKKRSHGYPTLATPFVERIFKALWLAKKMGDEPFLLVHRYFILADDYEVFSDSHRDGTLLQVEEKSKYYPLGTN